MIMHSSALGRKWWEDQESEVILSCMSSRPAWATSDYGGGKKKKKKKNGTTINPKKPEN